MSTVSNIQFQSPHKFVAPFGPDDSVFSARTKRSTPLAGATPTTAGPIASLDYGLPAWFPDDLDGEKVLTVVNDVTLSRFLLYDLDVARLNKIHKHLWLAGLPTHARTLVHQVLIGRSIVITEQADLHLVWHDDTMYLKPLPEYLLNYKTWEKSLCNDRGLFELASGMLLSYMWLVRSKSDLKLAHDLGLLPSEIDWPCWSAFSKIVLQTLEHRMLHGINPRYLYGELRLPRLNLVYRLCSFTTNFSTVIRGYHYGYHQYNTFIERNFAWLLIAIIYITVVLTAMQVGLGTKQLRNNDAFNRASYGFTVFSIIGPMAVLFTIVLILLPLMLFNLVYTLGTQVKKKVQYKHVFENETLSQYRHGGSTRTRRNLAESTHQA